MPPVVQVIQPNGYEKLEIGETYPIRWDAKDAVLPIGLQSVYYSTDGGSSWQNLLLDHQFEPFAPYQYKWNVPECPSDNWRALKSIHRSLDYGDKKIDYTDGKTSDKPFSICWFWVKIDA